jgi:hypothetical protein
MSSNVAFVSIVALTLLLVPAGVTGQETSTAGQEPGDRPEVGAPTPARPDASAPAAVGGTTPSPTGEMPEKPSAELQQGERWATVVPVLLWFAGEGKPRLQVCSEAFGAEVGDVCPIEGAPATARSLQIECEGWDCSKLAMRQPVELRMRVEGDRFVALGPPP